MNLKNKEVLGYHNFSKDSGWGSSYESFIERVYNGKKSQYLNFLIDIIEKKSGKLLDFASGTCWTSYILAEKGYNVTSLEMNSSDICGLGVFRKFREKMPFNALLGDCERSPVKEGIFDVVFCHQALHHATDLNKMVAEMARCTKKNGLVVAGGEHIRPFFTSDGEFRKNHPAVIFGANEHAYLYYQYKNAFKKAGIEKIKVIPRGFECDFDTISHKSIRWLVKSILRIPVIGNKIVSFILLNLSGAGTEITIYGFKS